MKNTILFIFAFLFSSISLSQNWINLNLPIAGRYDDVFFLDQNTGWALNSTGNIVSKTTDGGLTWNWQFNSNGEHLRNIVFLNQDIGFLGTLSSNFYKTNDGGQTWQVLSFPNVEAICGLDAIGDSTVYGCGAYFEPAYIIKSTDAGDNWSAIDMSAYATALVEVLFLDENTGFASGKNANGGIIIKTTDGGLTWTEIFNTEQPGEYVWKMQQLHSNSDAFFASVQSFAPNPGKLAKSNDGGQTWNTLDIVSNTQGTAIDPLIQGVGFVTESHGWASGYFSTLLETLDGGLTWNDIGNGMQSSINRFQVLNENLVFASGNRVYKYTNDLGTNDFVSAIPKGLEIIVSPNPIENELNISILFERRDHMVITLFDGQGRKIERLARETIQSKGERVYKFDFPYPAGVYFLHFHGDVGAKSVQIVKK